LEICEVSRHKVAPPISRFVFSGSSSRASSIPSTISRTSSIRSMDVFAATQVYPVTGERGSGDTMAHIGRGERCRSPGLAAVVSTASTIADTGIERRGGIVISPPSAARSGADRTSESLKTV
jgi:hypothetical protein